MTMPAIRRAAPADAEALAMLGAATFSETFGHLYPPADLAAHLAAEHGVAKTRATLTDAGNAAWLAEADGRPIGHALAGPCALPHPDVTGEAGELKRIYVLGPWRGGVGSALLAQALAWLERDGPRDLWIGVWSQNLAAQRLYARIGFAKVGEYEFAVGASRDHEFIMRRNGLAQAAATERRTA